MLHFLIHLLLPLLRGAQACHHPDQGTFPAPLKEQRQGMETAAVPSRRARVLLIPCLQ